MRVFGLKKTKEVGRARPAWPPESSCVCLLRRRDGDLRDFVEQLLQRESLFGQLVRGAHGVEQVGELRAGRHVPLVVLQQRPGERREDFLFATLNGAESGEGGGAREAAAPAAELLRVDSGDERPSVLNTLTVSVED